MQLAEHLPSSVDLAFVDVDLASSMRDCLLGLWPRLVHGATFFTHDAPFLKVLQALNDQETWASLGDHPPVIFGAGYGFGDASPYLGLLVKGQVDGTYMRHVTLANRPRPSISWVDMRRS